MLNLYHVTTCYTFMMLPNRFTSHHAGSLSHVYIALGPFAAGNVQFFSGVELLPRYNVVSLK